MDSIIAKAGETLVSLGLAGVVILAAGFAVVILWRQNQNIQQARIDDAKAMAKIIEQNSVETKLTSEVMRQVLSGMQQSAQQSQIMISEIRQALSDVRPRR